jgi:multidrug efflux system outer membrane protein
VRANIAAQDAKQQESIAVYEKTIREAVSEVETAINGYGREQERYEKLQTATAARRDAAKLLRDLYDHGLSDYFPVLEAESAITKAEDDLAECNVAILRNAVMLAKALGGGWEQVK